MNKDNVVIEEGGMRFVFEKSGSSACVGCKIGSLGDYACSMCASTRTNDQHPLLCISATKITQEPRIYHAWDREDARGLIGREVEIHGGNIDDEWEKRTLEIIFDDVVPFGLDSGRAARIIREIPQIKMTWEEAKAKYGIGDEVVIVEGD